MVLSALMATLEAVSLRALGSAVGMGQVLLFRSGVQLALVLLLALLLGGRQLDLTVRTARLRLHLLRGALAAVSWWCYFMSLRTLPLALSTTLTFSTQLFVLWLAWPLLRERATRAQQLATLIGFAGVLVAAGLVDPSTLDLRVGFGIAASLMGALMVLITRSLSLTERTGTIMFYMALVVFLSAIPQCLLYWAPLDGTDMGLLCLAGVAGTLGAWTMVEAYRRAETAALAPFTYTRFVFAGALGYALFGDVVAPSTWAGAALIVGANLWLVWYSGRRR
jgi:drug/metabolite transporter (DMT)-like permease